MRMIDADELIRNLEGIISDYTSNGIYPDRFGIDDFIDVVKEMPTIPAPQWISVEERLPDVDKTQSGYEKQYVIAATKNGVRPLIFERACIGNKVARRWKWAWDRIYDGSPVTHWMPLPEPPEEDVQ